MITRVWKQRALARFCSNICRSRAYYYQHRERLIAKTADRQQNHYGRERVNTWARAHHDKVGRVRKLAKQYNTTEEHVRQLLTIVACEICGNPATDIDHCHTSGKVRGRLCTNCNNGLGRFLDSEVLLRKAADYLRESL